ncbi:MAG: YitT family protein [Streptococcaceae bacterium]|nr:YitT family protein [Streptococcaceae bacterium]
MEEKRHYPFDLFMIALGTAIYAFGLVVFNIPNELAEGGLTGVTLILRALFGINPAWTSLILNVPIILLGGKFLGKRSFFYTIFATATMSLFLGIWPLFHINISVGDDMLIAAIFAGLAAGVGLGLVFRVGGTTGGSDVIGRILETRLGIPVGRTLFGIDILVLSASLIYIDIQHMMYTLIATFVAVQIIDSVQNGGYAVRGMLIISDKSEEIAQGIMELLGRGVTFLDGEGGFSHVEKKIVYVVLSPREILDVKRMVIEEIDERAFISVMNVHEAIGEGFSYDRPKKQKKFSFTKT